MFTTVRRMFPATNVVLAFVTLSGSPALAAGQGQNPAQDPQPPAQGSVQSDYAVKRSDVVLPNDVPVGQYRRITQPFPNWTLICDENLAKKQKVCNISQTIIDGNGNPTFSWSLAAADDGRPFFILRVPAAVGATGVVGMQLSDKGADVSISVAGCDSKVCIAYQQVGPRLRAAVNKGDPVKISFGSGDGAQKVSFSVPLQGLSDALAAI